MENTKKLSGKAILAIVLSIILVATAGIGIFMFLKKDPSNRVKGSDVELAGYAINKVNEKSSLIYDTYAKSSASGQSGALGNTNNLNFSINGDNALSLQNLQTYFMALSVCNTVPAAMDFVINSANTEVYANTFELNKTYMAIEYARDEEESTIMYYYRVEKFDNLINCYLLQDYEDKEESEVMYFCQINYDFENDKLISAKTIMWYDYYYQMFYIDYQSNEFTATVFTSSKPTDELFTNINYADITLEIFYRGNIVNNINKIEFEDFTKMPTGVETIFNSYYKEFAAGIQYKDAFDYESVVVNNSFLDAMEYSENKGDYYIRVNPNNKFEFQYISTWIGYDDVIKLLDDISLSESMNNKSSSKQLFTAYKNRLIERGKYSYTGRLYYEYDGNNFLDIVKVNDEIDTFLVSIITDDEGVFECRYQYKDNKLEYDAINALSVKFDAEKSYDGTYAIITGVDSRVIAVNIPTEIKVDGSVLPVKAFKGWCTGRNSLILNFPACVEDIDPWFVGSRIRGIYVHADNANYCSVDGVLYNKNKTEIVSYPGYRVAENYTILNSATTIGQHAFKYAEKIKTLTIPRSVTSGDFDDCYMDSLTSFNVEAGSTAFSSHNGMLYNADGTKLISCPAKKSGEVTVKSGTLELDSYAFANAPNITAINLPDTLTTIKTSFGYNIKTIVIPDSVTSISFGWHTAYLSKMIIGEANTTYAMDANNFVYSKDMKTLYFVPSDISGVVTIPSHVTKIGYYVFHGHGNITEIIVPSSVVELESRAFGHYSGAKKITFQGAIELNSYDFGPFSQAYDLVELSLAGLVGDLEWKIFNDCENFHTINYNGTKADFQSHVVGTYDLDIVITVHCTDGDLTYSK